METPLLGGRWSHARQQGYPVPFQRRYPPERRVKRSSKLYGSPPARADYLNPNEPPTSVEVEVYLAGDTIPLRGRNNRGIADNSCAALYGAGLLHRG